MVKMMKDDVRIQVASSQSLAVLVSSYRLADVTVPVASVAVVVTV